MLIDKRVDLHAYVLIYTHILSDGARYLPSSVTVSRVAGRIFDRNFKVVGPAISSGVVLESDVYNPSYKYSVAIPGGPLLNHFLRKISSFAKLLSCVVITDLGRICNLRQMSF